MSRQRVDLGEIVGVFGVAGWVKVKSDTEPKEKILAYSPWSLTKNGETVQRKAERGTLHGKGLIVRIEGAASREEAAKLCGMRISVDRDRLPPTEEGEYYWADLIGLRVFTIAGVALGTVDSILETGANDVLVVKGERERLIPFLQGLYVLKIDLAAETMTVDWDPKF